jgi:hypothetical protein
MSNELSCLNSSFKVVSYNGGPILGRYGINSVFNVQPGQSCRPTATSSGQLFDLVLEYNGESHANFTLTHLVIVSPNFDEVTSMLKSGVVFVTDTNSHTSYTQHYNTFHKDKQLPTIKDIPSPVAMFDYNNEKTQSSYAVADGPIESRNGKFLHIKLNESFDDDFNIDIGHFFIIGYHGKPSTSNPTIINEQTIALPTPSFTNIMHINHRSWLLQHGYLSTISKITNYNELLCQNNSTLFFSGTSLTFIATKPIHTFLSYIDGESDISTLSTEDQEFVTNFIRFNKAAHLYTNLWRQYFTSDLISANLQKQIGTKSLSTPNNKNNNNNHHHHHKQQNKQLDMPQEINFFTIDPTSSNELLSIALAHLGELQSENHITTNNNNIVLSNGTGFTIIASLSAGPCHKYNFHSQNFDQQAKIFDKSNEISVKSMANKIFDLQTALVLS